MAQTPFEEGLEADRIRKRLASRSRALDLLIAAGAVFLGVSLTIGLYDDLTAPAKLAVLSLAVVHGAALFWRRTHPWPSFAVVLGAGLAVLALGMPLVVLNLTPLVAIYSLASADERRRSIWGAVVGVAGLALSQLVADNPSDASTIIGDLVAIGAAWVIGTFVFERQRYVMRLETRTRELHAARQELAEQAVAEERLRIARELHDVVAHSLSIIAVQSGMGAHVAEANPGEASRALAAVEEVSRQALTEMRRLLGVLRDDGDAPDSAPAPSITRLDVLIDQVRSAGITIDVVRDPALPPLPPGLDLTAYRVLQESLTNVVKHAHASTVRVSVAAADGTLTLEVVDDGVAGSQAEPAFGHGLEGMRERVSLFGGRLDAGPMKHGGFRVRADLPMEAE